MDCLVGLGGMGVEIYFSGSMYRSPVAPLPPSPVLFF